MEIEDVKLTDLMKYFESTSGQFAKEWKELSDSEKLSFKQMYLDGIEKGYITTP